MSEISGVFYDTASKQLFGIADDKPIIYIIDPDSDSVAEHFVIPGDPKDLEDITRVDSITYVLISNGTIIQILPGGATESYPFPSSEKNDFETLYYDHEAKSLVTVCKTCAHEKGTRLRTAYRFDLAGKKFDAEPYYQIRAEDINAYLKDGRFSFEPSAAAINPKNNRLYVLGSSGNLLVVTDKKGQVYSAYRLNPGVFPQSEGIAFAADGEMFVSNEAKLGKPSLLRFRYYPPGTGKNK